MAWKPDYLTVEEYKAYPRVDDDVDDDELASAITAASRAIDVHCNRQFGQVAPEARVYKAWYNVDRCRWAVSIDDLQTTVGLVVTVSGVTVTDYTLEPRNAVADGKAWTSLVLGRNAEAQPSWADECEVAAIGPWGWSAFPGAVVQAAKLQTSRLAARRDSPFGVAGSPQTGSELRLLARLDPDVKVVLGGLRRPRKAG